jgi:hypothetical protein
MEPCIEQPCIEQSCIEQPCIEQSCIEQSSARFKRRAIIEFLTSEDVYKIEIHRRIHGSYGADCDDVSTVHIRSVSLL